MIMLMAPPVPPTTKPRLLIVEDDTSSRDALSRIFEMLGYEITAAPNLADARRQLQHYPKYLILDLMLPDGNGMDILRQIRDQKLPIQVAVVTGADKPMIAQAQSLHPDALFTKPLDVTALIHWLKSAA